MLVTLPLFLIGERLLLDLWERPAGLLDLGLLLVEEDTCALGRWSCEDDPPPPPLVWWPCLLPPPGRKRTSTSVSMYSIPVLFFKLRVCYAGMIVRHIKRSNIRNVNQSAVTQAATFKAKSGHLMRRPS